MALKQKFFDDSHGAAFQLWNDVGTNNIKFYDVADYASKATISVHPDAVMEKFSHVSIAVSGSAHTGKDWMLIAPYRVDRAKKMTAKVHDLDPILFVLDRDTDVPHQSGVVAYHHDFQDRTMPIPGNYESVTIAQTVQSLRSTLTTGLQPLERAPSEVLEALQHMFKKFGSDFV